MSEPYISASTAAKLTKLIIAVFVVMLMLVFYVFWQSYQGRVDLVESQRKGCERGKKDRLANADGWRIAQAARLADGQVAVAAKYEKIAKGLEKRGRINCENAFPKAGFFP